MALQLEVQPPQPTSCLAPVGFWWAWCYQGLRQTASPPDMLLSSGRPWGVHGGSLACSRFCVARRASPWPTQCPQAFPPRALPPSIPPLHIIGRQGSAVLRAGFRPFPQPGTGWVGRAGSGPSPPASPWTLSSFLKHLICSVGPTGHECPCSVIVAFVGTPSPFATAPSPTPTHPKFGYRSRPVMFRACWYLVGSSLATASISQSFFIFGCVIISLFFFTIFQVFVFIEMLLYFVKKVGKMRLCAFVKKQNKVCTLFFRRLPGLSVFWGKQLPFWGLWGGVSRRQVVRLGVSFHLPWLKPIHSVQRRTLRMES